MIISVDLYLLLEIGAASPAPLSILRDPLWQFIGVVVALVAVITSVVVSLISRPRKQISLSVLAKDPMLQINNRVRDRLEIRYSGELVSDIHYLCLMLVNTGNVPIKPSDFEEEIVFGFGSDSKILDAEMVTTPLNVRSKIDVAPTLVMLGATLLNPDDRIWVNVLLEKFDGNVYVQSRIEGIRDISIFDRSIDDDAAQKRTRRLIYGAGAFGYGWGMVCGIFPITNTPGAHKFLFLPELGLGVAIIGAVTMAITLTTAKDSLIDLLGGNREFLVKVLQARKGKDLTGRGKERTL